METEIICLRKGIRIGMNSTVFACPYFGKLEREQFKLWLASCKANDTIDFVLLLDDESALIFDMPSNVHAIKMTWEECRELAQKQFDFKIKMEYAYKLCDLRPAFGQVFAEYIGDHDFWGHMDISDTILGNLRKFLADEILEQYDKVHIYGHLTLYRNTKENNERFRIAARSGMTVEQIYSVEENVCFDDMYQPASINTIFKENGFPLLEKVDDLVADILPDKWRFRLSGDSGYIPRVFEWDDGTLFECTVVNGQLQKREVGYVHFQKRTVLSEVSEADHYYLIPNRFISASEELQPEQIAEWSRDKVYFAPVLGRVKRMRWYFAHPEAFARKIKQKLS